MSLVVQSLTDLGGSASYAALIDAVCEGWPTDHDMAKEAVHDAIGRGTIVWDPRLSVKGVPEDFFVLPDWRDPRTGVRVGDLLRAEKGARFARDPDLTQGLRPNLTERTIASGLLRYELKDEAFLVVLGADSEEGVPVRCPSCGGVAFFRAKEGWQHPYIGACDNCPTSKVRMSLGLPSTSERIAWEFIDGGARIVLRPERQS